METKIAIISIHHCGLELLFSYFLFYSFSQFFVLIIIFVVVSRVLVDMIFLFLLLSLSLSLSPYFFFLSLSAYLSLYFFLFISHPPSLLLSHLVCPTSCVYMYIRISVRASRTYLLVMESHCCLIWTSPSRALL